MASEDVTIDRLTLRGWRQFESVDLDLSSRLTVITGANGAGKTSILSLIGQLFQWSPTFLSVPYRAADGTISYMSNVWAEEPEDSEMVDQSVPEPYRGHTVGRVIYSDGSKGSVAVHGSGSMLYSVGISMPPRMMMNGLFLSSHRSLSEYQRVEYLPAEFNEIGQILEQYLSEIRGRIGGYRASELKSPMFRMKEALLSAAIFGEGNSSLAPNVRALEVWTGFQDVLKILLPKSLGFKRLIAMPPEIVIDSSTGQFTLDAASGGITALLELAWQIFLRSRQHDNFTVCFDEPENHLHPSLQRSVIPSLLSAFPNVKFIVSTHSPFVVTASQYSKVYVLQYNEKDRVEAHLLNFADKSAAAEEVLSKVLGMESTLPIWAESKFDEIIARYLSRTTLEAGDLISLRNDLQAAGLGGKLPSAIDAFSRKIASEGDSEE
ncbi:AAA family ATPase [Amycolatopsis sp. NPDC049159]|uniref:AAA family ATPase n=1 Tax=Amycolatopsis sp. NPDC049159 TaxID=3157210 RepID=UPI0033DACBD1